MSDHENGDDAGTDEQLSPVVSSAPVRRICQGPVMPIGGAENKDGNPEILNRFVALAGGVWARIVVVPTASEDPEGMGQDYVKVFGALNAGETEVLRIDDREDANGPEAIALLEQATGIFLTGGAQERLVKLLVGTQAMECIRERNADGVVVAGTSAGASILPAHAMVGGTGEGGNSNDSSARKNMVDLVAGFGLLQDAMIDQHFSQRGRLGRLMAAFAANPGLLGIGLDEDTAVLIERDGTLEVLGSNMVTIVDGRSAKSNFFEIEDGEVLTVSDSHLFVLGPGRRFDLDARMVIWD